MTKVQRTKPGSSVTPDILEDRPLAAEVLVAPRTLTVTIAVPVISEADLDVLLTRHSIRVRSKRNPPGPSYVIPLPVAVEPERYVLRRKNGVLDFLVERASR